MGKLLIIVGIVCIISGLFIIHGPKIPWLGKLPGDISVEKDNLKFFFPITTCIIVSIVFSLLLYLYQRLKD
ncbi:MAG: DUF2905 domain-containing protein [Chryseolinea sp.]